MTEHVGVCEKHRKDGYEVKIVEEDTKYIYTLQLTSGTRPKSTPSQTTSSDRCTQQGGITSEERSKVTTSTSKKS